jgi:hydroxymethylglutaryl-CoA synthase
MNVDIWGYGISVPYHRVKPEAIHEVWKNTPFAAVARLGVKERSVLGADEDTLTLALDAATQALTVSGLPREQIGALILGSQTAPYLTRPGAAFLVDGLGLPQQTFAADLQFSSKSGTSALLMGLAYVKAGMARAAIVVGADTLGPHVSPGDSSEYTAGSGAAAVVISGPGGLATILASSSCTSDTPDWFRLDGERYIRTGGAAMVNTGVGMRNHMLSAWNSLASAIGTDPTQLQYLVTQQSDPKSSLGMAKALGFSEEQVQPGIFSDRLGDCGSAAPFLGLVRVLDQAESGAKIALVSYGAGAGSDAFLFETTDKVEGCSAQLEKSISRKTTVDYATYIKLERKYLTHERKVSTFD